MWLQKTQNIMHKFYGPLFCSFWSMIVPGLHSLMYGREQPAEHHLFVFFGRH